MGYVVAIINGSPASGKTTFEHYCQEYLGSDKCFILSTVDLVKQLAKECGWDGMKTLESRKFLSDLKYFLSDTYLGDVTFNDVCGRIEHELYKYEQFEVEPRGLVFFVDAREPAQIQRFKEELNAITVVIRNSKAEQMAVSNSADAHALEFDYDYSVSNDGSLVELKQKAEEFCEWVVRRNG